MQSFLPGHTTWHITWGTYGTRIHGDNRPTVDREHNEIGERLVQRDRPRETVETRRMKHPAVWLTAQQRRHIQDAIPGLCGRGGWHLRICAAESNHIHVLLDIHPDTHGQAVRRLLKRWLTQSLNDRFGRRAHWWAEEGSNKAIRDAGYLQNAYRYVARQVT